MTVNAFAAASPGSDLVPYQYTLPDLGDQEVDIEVLYCGICHSDLSMLDNDWRITQYPFVPGHEIVGIIKATGKNVSHLKIGEHVGVGWNAGSCNHCNQCIGGKHNLCHSVQPTIVGRYGGFGDIVRVEGVWAFKIPAGLDLASLGPIFCGGITVFHPFIQHKISPLSKVGIVGIGGLGHMAILFAKAWGCEVTAFSTSPEKEEEAKSLGAHHFVSTHDLDGLKKLKNTFDLIIDTVNVELDWNAYVNTLRSEGVFHIVGVASEVKVRVGSLMGKQRSISASPTGSPIVIRQMLDFAARHQIKPMVEMFKMSQVNEAMNHLKNGKPKFRIVLER
jgi:alcohol/geraniol dehydrogenase (NADP+)